MNILMLVGSLRAESWTRQLVDATSALLPEDAHSEVYAGLRDLPHYDQDLDGDDVPAPVTAFREAVASADALVVASPEYNGTIPGVLKNAIDWASRPRGASALQGMPVAVLSVSPSPRGAQWAREDLVKVLGVAGAQPLENAVGVATVHEVVTDGQITDPGVRQALTELVAALVDAEQERRAA
jgi:NAD(P)H-dependent FMN reductase